MRGVLFGGRVVPNGFGSPNLPFTSPEPSRVRQVSLAVSDANMELPWDLLDESAGYLWKLAHVTARQLRCMSVRSSVGGDI